jgi:hypothetical protein
MKPLKFSEPLPEKVLEGEKDTTWRIGDEKEISVNDELSLRTVEGEEFARARVLWVKNTIFGRLTEEDREGHESFDSREEMYRTYSDYYDTEVGPDTKVKVVKFRLL